MTENNGTITLPNPYTPMAFLPPDLARNLSNELYAAVATAGSLVGYHPASPPRL
jgi:hypothetical protein